MDKRSVLLPAGLGVKREAGGIRRARLGPSVGAPLGDAAPDDSLLYSCVVCAAPLSYRKIKKHIREHLEYAPIRCSLCGHNFYDETDVALHFDPRDHPRLKATITQSLDEEKEKELSRYRSETLATGAVAAAASDVASNCSVTSLQSEAPLLSPLMKPRRRPKAEVLDCIDLSASPTRLRPSSPRRRSDEEPTLKAAKVELDSAAAQTEPMEAEPAPPDVPPTPAPKPAQEELADPPAQTPAPQPTPSGKAPSPSEMKQSTPPPSEACVSPAKTASPDKDTVEETDEPETEMETSVPVYESRSPLHIPAVPKAQSELGQQQQIEKENMAEKMTSKDTLPVKQPVAAPIEKSIPNDSSPTVPKAHSMNIPSPPSPQLRPASSKLKAPVAQRTAVAKPPPHANQQPISMQPIAKNDLITNQQPIVAEPPAAKLPPKLPPPKAPSRKPQTSPVKPPKRAAVESFRGKLEAVGRFSAAGLPPTAAVGRTPAKSTATPKPPPPAATKTPTVTRRLPGSATSQPKTPNIPRCDPVAQITPPQRPSPPQPPPPKDDEDEDSEESEEEEDGGEQSEDEQSDEGGSSASELGGDDFEDDEIDEDEVLGTKAVPPAPIPRAAEGAAPPSKVPEKSASPEESSSSDEEGEGDEGEEGGEESGSEEGEEEAGSFIEEQDEGPEEVEWDEDEESEGDDAQETDHRLIQSLPVANTSPPPLSAATTTISYSYQLHVKTAGLPNNYVPHYGITGNSKRQENPGSSRKLRAIEAAPSPRGPIVEFPETDDERSVDGGDDSPALNATVSGGEALIRSLDVHSPVSPLSTSFAGEPNLGGNKRMCQLCRLPASISNLKYHIGKHHMPAFRVSCKFCEFGEPWHANRIANHMRTKHPNEKEDNYTDRIDEFELMMPTFMEECFPSAKGGEDKKGGRRSRAVVSRAANSATPPTLRSAKDRLQSCRLCPPDSGSKFTKCTYTHVAKFHMRYQDTIACRFCDFTELWFPNEISDHIRASHPDQDTSNFLDQRHSRLEEMDGLLLDCFTDGAQGPESGVGSIVVRGVEATARAPAAARKAPAPVLQPPPKGRAAAVAKSKVPERICLVCQASVETTQRELADHVWTNHVASNRLSCKLCSYSDRRKQGAMKQHFGACHKNDDWVRESEDKTKELFPEFQKYLLKCFGKRANLKADLNTTIY